MSDIMAMPGFPQEFNAAAATATSDFDKYKLV